MIDNPLLPAAAAVRAGQAQLAENPMDGDPAQQKTALNKEESQVAALLGLTAKEFTEAKAQT